MPHDIWSVIVIVGLFGWLFSCIMFMFRAFPQKDVFDISHGIRWGVGALISFIVWIVGMLQA